MRGKVTFREGLHHSRTGEIVESITIGAGEWRELEHALGPLDETDRAEIADYCALLQSLWQEARIPAADVRVTLDKIASEKSDDTILQAFANCDATSSALIEQFLYRLDGPEFFKQLDAIPPSRLATKIRAAAHLALDSYSPSRGPSVQGWQRLTAEYAIQLAKWKGLPHTAHAFAELVDEEEPAQVVQVLLTLLGLINPNDSAQSVSWCVKLIGEINSRSA